MDLKQLFDYEHLLLVSKPDFTAEENQISLLTPEKADETISFNIVPGTKEGAFIKLASKNGKSSKMTYLNPVVARALVQDLTNMLNAQGFGADDMSTEKSPVTRTIH